MAEMNGFAALDAAFGICSPVTKRGLAASPPGFPDVLLHFLRDIFAKND